MKEEIYNAQYIHYENLLIKKLDEIATNYKKRKIIQILSPIVSFIITILGWSNDNIGAKILDNVMNFIGINLDAIGISNIIYVVMNVSSVGLSIYAMIRAREIKKGITIEFLKEPIEQDKLLFRYILDKYKNQLPYQNEIKLGKHYLADLKTTEIQFYKSELRDYIAKYFGKFNADYDVSRYLAEVIILRQLMKKQMIDIGDEFYKEIISSKNYIKYQLVIYELKDEMLWDTHKVQSVE